MVKEWKPKKVEELASEIDKSKVVGLIDMHKLPSAQLQSIKKELRSDAAISMARKSLILRALVKAKKKGASALGKIEADSPALIISDEDAFKLYSKIRKKQVPSYAKAGDKAPYDLVIPEGDTSLAPGPVIGELQKVGIKAKIMGNKITVSEDSVVAKEGDEISPQLSSILMQLDVKPMKVGLNMVAAVEDGTLFGKDVLAVDEKEYEDKIVAGVSRAFNLAVNAGIIVKQTVPLLVSQAAVKALNLAVNAGILNKKTVEMLVQKAGAQASALSSLVPSAPAAEPEKKEEVKEEPAEEKKEEASEEKVEEKPEEKAEEAPAEEKKEEAAEEKEEKKE